jgi:hypothetical protein
MYTSVSGIYRNGRIELKEQPQNVHEDTQVIVTFLNENEVDLRAHNIDQKQAAELRARLTPFSEDWNSPEMDIYDNYDATRAILEAGGCGSSTIS